jgi:CBS domain-containing protein
MTLMRQFRRSRPKGLPSSSYVWLGAATAATAAVTLLGRRGWRSKTGKVRDVMIPAVVTIEPSATLIDAARRMKDANVGVLPIVDGGILRGIVTDRDLVVRAMADGVDPARTPVADCATRDLVCARPDTSIEDAMEVMADCQVGRLPVVDRDDRLVGILTLSSMALRSRDGDDALDTAKQVSKRSARN